MTYSYGSSATVPAVDGGPQAVTRVSRNVGQTISYDYDPRGNLDGRYEGTTLTHGYTFDVENRLTSVKIGASNPTQFTYDADGQRVMTTQPDGTIIYTPFPDYELTDPPTGADTVRTTYRLDGQIVAVQTKVGAAAGVFYYTYTDHLGNITAMSTTAGALVTDSTARYDPFGNYRTTPATTTNPAISNHGFTGHRMNNTGANNLGLITMNARNYLPEVGRFVSADSIVPEPENPQSYNRYSYVLNSPMNYTDPTGHMDDAGAQLGGGSSNQLINYSPASGYVYALISIPFTPISSSDSRTSELRSIICTPASGCSSVSSIVPTYLASSTSIPGENVARGDGQREIGQMLGVWGTGMDMFSTTISSAGLAVQLVATATFGPIGPDDLLAHGAYSVVLDPLENAISVIAAGAVITGDFFSGASNVSIADRQVQIGQDTMFVASTAVIGQFIGQVPFVGSALDTGVNLAVNSYDLGRLANRIPSIAEMRIDSGGVYVVFYP